MQPSDNYVATLLSVISANPDRTVLRWRDRVVTAAELIHSVTTAAAVMRHQGIGRTSTVTLLTTGNNPDMLVMRYAANLLGATVLQPQSLNAINALDAISVQTQAAILAESGSSLLAVDEPNIERARAITARMATPPVLAAFGGESAGLVDLSSARGCEPFSLSSAVTGTTATVVYTSGSTSGPKGIERDFGTLHRYVEQMKAFKQMPVMLITTPLGQSGAFMADGAFACDGTVVLHEGFDTARVLEAIAKDRISHLYLAAPQLYLLVDHPAREATDTSSLRQIVYSGCTASPHRVAEAVEVFGPILMQSYGSSEALAISILGPSEHFHPKLLATVGRPLPSVQVAIRDPRTGEDLPVGQSGEVCVRSPNMMDRYWRNPELTAQTVRNGWVHTGDVGYLDDEGYLHLVDRLAGMIKTRGIKVYPATIENALLAHPAVAQAAVFGVADADNVEHIHAAVVLHAGREVDPAELDEHVELTLSAAYVPEAITVLAEMPSLDSGKPDKRSLRLDAEVAAGWRRLERSDAVHAAASPA